MNLNRVDFERAGTGRKAGYKFMIQFTEGRVTNVISGSPLAMNLAAVMLEDESTKKILKLSQYEVSLNTKFQLLTKNCRAAALPEPEAEDANVEKEPAEAEAE